MTPGKMGLVLLKAPFFSPCGLLVRAGLLAGTFGVLHLLGLREYTSIICGTSPTGNVADGSAVWGVLYAFFHFAFVLGVPILVLAAGILVGVLSLGQRPGVPGTPYLIIGQRRQ
jgi:hypothetical protein